MHFKTGNVVQLLQRANPIRLLTTCFTIATLAAIACMPIRAQASQAYGSANNFDCVNDTGEDAHGFDIELDDIRSKDITYTYDYNHYGIPKITEDLSDPAHPKVLVRYAASRNPDGTWTAYTAIPSGPISPTQGHQFTDPSVNFGGEHFGVGYYGTPSAIKYNWLVDDGTGNLKQGPPVFVATPTFTYYPPAAAPAKVVAEIVVPPEPQVLQFGVPSWVKAIKTTTHNPNKVRLQDLVADDPGKPQPWTNGEPAQVEKEWSLLQTEFAAANGGVNGGLQGAPEDLPGGDEVITRRYEFYKYVGPCDAETGEAMATAVAADGVHGVGYATYADYFDVNLGEWHIVTKNLSKMVVVGKFFGAQMSGFDVAPALGLIDHVQDGEVGTAYPERAVVIPGGSPWLASIKSGALPDGLSLDLTTGVLSGTPTTAGMFTFEVEASDLSGALVTKSYNVSIAGNGAPAVYTITTSASPAIGGTTSGDGVYNAGDSVTIGAYPNLGYKFGGWFHSGVHFSQTASTTFLAGANLDLVASFLRKTITTVPSRTALPGTTVSLSGNLKVDKTTFLSGKSLNFFLDGVKLGSAVTDASGWASLSYTIPVDGVLGSVHPIAVVFADKSDPVYATSGGRGYLTIDKTSTKVLLSNLSTKANTKITIYASLRSIDKLALQGKTLHFWVDGVEIGTGVTGTTGWTSCRYLVPAGLPVGSTYPITVSFTDTADPLYLTSSTTRTLTIVP